MSEDYVTTTQQIFQDVITKPKLQDKYLRRPPFRFIHDIIMNTMKSTGFPQGLFLENELIGKNIKEKQQKISWLNKLIQCIQSVTNETLQANANKIVAGLEAEQTNIMLQAFGQIAIQVANGELSMDDILSNINNPNSERNNEISSTPQSTEPSQAPSYSQRSLTPKPQSDTKPNATNTIDTTKSIQDVEDWIAETQQTLGELIERPRLLTKLLKRPPFRFLHDILKSLIKSTGFPLAFMDEDKDITNANIKDAKFKYYFLSKLIAIVSAAIDEDLSFIDPKNIIAGRNPEDTNRLLTKLGYAATLNVDVDEVKNKINLFSQNMKSQKEKQKKESKAKTEDKPQKQSENIGKNTARKPLMPKLELDQLQKRSGTQSSKKPIKPAAAVVKQKVEPELEEKENQFRAIQKLQRPRTARRAPPKLKTNVIEEKQNEVKHDLFIMDDDENDKKENGIEDIEDVDNLENEEHINKGNEDTELERLGFINNMRNESNVVNDESDGNHGKLVRDILDAQSGIKLESMRLGTHRRGDSAKSVERVENMREMIQKICQTCLPLTKCIDLVFEDVEAINNEILKWKQQITKNQTQLTQEKEQTNKILSPLYEEMQVIEEQIKNQKQLILEKHAVLLKNETRVNDIIRKRLLNE